MSDKCPVCGDQGCTNCTKLLPAAYQPKEILTVEAESPGWLLKFTCGHIVWCAIPARIGETMVCGVCLNNFADDQLGRAKAAP